MNDAVARTIATRPCLVWALVGSVLPFLVIRAVTCPGSQLGRCEADTERYTMPRTKRTTPTTQSTMNSGTIHFLVSTDGEHTAAPHWGAILPSPGERSGAGQSGGS